MSQITHTGTHLKFTNIIESTSSQRFLIFLIFFSPSLESWENSYSKGLWETGTTCMNPQSVPRKSKNKDLNSTHDQNWKENRQFFSRWLAFDILFWIMVLSLFLPVDVYARSGPVTDSVNVANQDQDLVLWGWTGIGDRGSDQSNSQHLSLYIG